MTDVEVKKSPNDKRQYRRLVLENGLQALLIFDPKIPANAAGESQQVADCTANQSPSAATQELGEDEEMSVDSEEVEDGTTKKAAAAMAVGVGSFSDPPNMQGMAHYLEHMLFMGSEKFPDENSYDDYLNTNGGYSNAWTDKECTTYYFKVNGNALHGAMDRFAQFFVAPLCLEDSLDREVLAVDSEFSLDRQDDGWRLQGMVEDSAKDGHVFRLFGLGNKITLKSKPEAMGLHVRNELLRFYKSKYSAERMCLTVLGGTPLDELQSWVQDMFSGVTSGLGCPVTFKDNGNPFQGQSFCVMEAINQIHQICVGFPLPCLLTEYKKKSEHYISHLIGHEGPGSLLSELKRRGWVVDLTAGVPHGDSNANTCISLFEVTMSLTETGLHAEPGYGLAPVKVLFQYIQMLGKAGPTEWVYDEIQTVQDIKIKFLEETEGGSYVSWVSRNMLRVHPGDELLCDYMYEDWDAERVGELLALMHPLADGLRIDLQTNDFEKVSAALTEQSSNGSPLFVETEGRFHPWFEFKYTKSQLHAEFLKSWTELPLIPELHLPPKNPYIPHDFTLQDSSSQTAAFVQPNLLTDKTGLRMWHKVDDLHKTPKAAALFLLSSPQSTTSRHPLNSASPKAAATDHLLVTVLEDVLTEECYMAEMASLKCSVVQAPRGLQFYFAGFSEKLPVLVRSVFETFSNLQEELIRVYENQNNKVQKHSKYLRAHVLNPLKWHVDDILQELRTLTAQDIQGHLEILKQNVHIEALVYGNIKSEEALRMCKEIRATVGGSTLHADACPPVQCLKLPIGHHYTQLPAKNRQESNSSLDVYFQCGTDDLLSRSKLEMIEQICDEPTFNILRTKEQLGYLVHSRALFTYGVLGFAFGITSERFAPNYLESRVEEFLKTFEQTLAALTDAELEKHRSALIETKLEKDKNLTETSSRLWSHITTGIYDFDARPQEVQTIKQLTKQELLDWYKVHLSPDQKDRKKFSVFVICPKHKEQSEAETVPADYLLVKDVESFRSDGELFPPPAAKSWQN